MNKKGIIDTYTTLYGIDIVVVNQFVKLNNLKKLFAFSKEEGLTDEILSGCACTCKVIRKKDDKLVSLVKFNGYDLAKTEEDRRKERINFAAHEATHVALDIYNYIGSVVPTKDEYQEPFAYLVGYATSVIYKTFCKK